MSHSRWVHIEVEKVIRETEKAFLFLLEDGEEVWIPKSQMADPDDYEQGDGNCTVSVSEFIAREKGFEIEG